MLNPNELLASPVVANAIMNRGRGLSGVNSYERELRLGITQFLKERVQAYSMAVWYDACCGQGRALAEAGEQFTSYDWGHQVKLVGVDLVEMFLPEKAPGVQLISADVATFALDRPADLITCVHGLHYLGDKLGFIQKAYAMLAPGGILVGHLDVTNLRFVESETSLWRCAVRYARKQGVALEIKNHLLFIKRTAAILDFGLAFRGATISERPNYTGITVIDSWYAPSV